jgi:ubiquinone/menaquinone biosynthesis C-methylase UbiE
MDTEALGDTPLGKTFMRLTALIMESRFRYKFFAPDRILKGAGIRPGMKVLELGCGTGFFTIPAAKIIGKDGSLTAMDVLPISVETVTQKVRQASLSHVVRVVKGDALDTKLEKETFDEVIVLGVIPAPMLPLDKLLQEIHRVLRSAGIMAVWPRSWVHKAIVQSGRFKYLNRQNGVSNYQRVDQS